MSDDLEADARLLRELVEQGRAELFDAVKYSRQQRADLRRIAIDILRARRQAARAASG